MEDDEAIGIALMVGGRFMMISISRLMPSIQE